MPTLYVIAGPNGVGKTTFADRRCGTSHVIFEDERMKALKADETEPYEERAQQNLERINRKIAEFQKRSSETLTLNERPSTDR